MTAAEHIAGQLDLDGQPVPPQEVAAPNPTHITITVEVEIDLSADECWPDGEPQQWTVQTLADVIKGQTLARFLDDWDLLSLGGSVDISDGNRNWTRVDLR